MQASDVKCFLEKWNYKKLTLYRTKTVQGDLNMSRPMRWHLRQT